MTLALLVAAGALALGGRKEQPSPARMEAVWRATGAGGWPGSAIQKDAPTKTAPKTVSPNITATIGTVPFMPFTIPAAAIPIDDMGRCIERLDYIESLELVNGQPIDVEVKAPVRPGDAMGGMDLVINYSKNATHAVNSHYPRLINGLRFWRGIVRLRPPAGVAELPQVVSYDTKMHSGRTGGYYLFGLRNLHLSDGTVLGRHEELYNRMTTYPRQFTHGVLPSAIDGCITEYVHRKFQDVYYAKKARGRNITVNLDNLPPNIPHLIPPFYKIVYPLMMRYYGRIWDWRIVSYGTYNGEHNFDYGDPDHDSLHSYYVFAFAKNEMDYIVRVRHAFVAWGLQLATMASSIFGSYLDGLSNIGSAIWQKIQEVYEVACDTLERAWNFIKNTFVNYFFKLDGIFAAALSAYALGEGETTTKNWIKTQYEDRKENLIQACETRSTTMLRRALNLETPLQEGDALQAASIEKVVLYAP